MFKITALICIVMASYCYLKSTDTEFGEEQETIVLLLYAIFYLLLAIFLKR